MSKVAEKNLQIHPEEIHPQPSYGGFLKKQVGGPWFLGSAIFKKSRNNMFKMEGGVGLALFWNNPVVIFNNLNLQVSPNESVYGDTDLANQYCKLNKENI